MYALALEVLVVGSRWTPAPPGWEGGDKMDTETAGVGGWIAAVGYREGLD